MGSPCGKGFDFTSTPTQSRSEYLRRPRGFIRYDNFRLHFWAPAAAVSGISSEDEPFTFHELRHAAVAFMIDNGADPLQVMRRMGRSDIRTTYNLCGHLFPDREDALVAGLDDRYKRALEGPSQAEIDSVRKRT